MRTLIVFFSQTGNTRSIAHRIAEGIVENGWECDLLSLDRVGREIPRQYDSVGLGSPVFYYQEPFNVRDFLNELPDLCGQPWFVFCTHGNVIGNFFPSVAEKLAAKGASLIGCFNSYADITVLYYPHPSYTTGHPDRTDFDRARQFGREMAGLAGTENPGSLEVPLTMTVSSEEWNKQAEIFTPEFLDRIMPRLSWDPDLCTGCHLCVDNCPVGGIDLEADPPRLQNPCIYCHYCVNVCKTGALGADWSKFAAAAPAQYKAYRQELDRAAAKGDFRWLVDPAKIDLDRPLFSQRR